MDDSKLPQVIAVSWGLPEGGPLNTTDLEETAAVSSNISSASPVMEIGAALRFETRDR
jgi:hypothetical protein